MIKKQHSIPILFVAMLIGALFSPVNASELLQVAVSILPQVYFIEQIGGDFVDVLCMLPEGGLPHTYEPTAQQMRQLSQTDVYIRLGVDFENAWWEKMAAANPKMYVVDSTKGVTFLTAEAHKHQENGEEHERGRDAHEQEDDHHEHQGRDPHTWLSPRMVKIQAENIYQGLITVDPDHQDTYAANKTAFLNTLNKLDADIQNRLANLRTRKFTIFHPSWAYFARDYDLEQISIEMEGKEPSAKEMTALMKFAKNEHIDVIFIQPQTSRRSADTIARQIGARVEILDPLAADWLENMRRVANILAETLSQ